MRKLIPAPRDERGFSIVELLVAIALGGILMTGAISLFVNNRDTSRMTTDIARMQETARFAMEMILSDARMAGFFGCVDNMGSVASQVSGLTTGELADTTFAIEGFESDDDRWRPSGFNNGGALIGTDGTVGLILTGTDAVTFRFLAGTHDDTDTDDVPDAMLLSFSSGKVTVNNLDGADFGLESGDLVGVADCGGADVFELSAAPSGDELRVDGGTLSRSYDTNPAMVAPLKARRYYVGQNARGNPALFRAVLDPGAVETYEELLEGVENLQVLYGLDRNGNDSPDVFVPATGIGGGNVVAVKIGLLIRSASQHRFGEDEAAIRNREYTLLGEGPLTFNDLRRRRLFTSTALLRNMQ